MKKFMSRVLGIVLVVTMVFSAVPSMAEANRSTEDSSVYDIIAAEFGTEFAVNYVMAMELLNSFYDSLPQDRMGEVIYPCNFGGVYIDGNGNLVILVVEGSPRDDMIHGLATDGAMVREVKFTYNALRDAFDFLDYYIPNNQDNPAAANVNSISLDIPSNQVLVLLANYTEDEVYLFISTVLDAPYLLFMKSPERHVSRLYYNELPEVQVENFDYRYYISNQLFVPTSTTIIVRPGDPLYIAHPIGGVLRGGSVGYRATYHNRQGFTTAAHNKMSGGAWGRQFHIGDHVFNRYGQHIGTIMRATLHTNDMAFFRVENNVIINNWVPHGLLLNEARPNFVPGSVVFLNARYTRGRGGFVRGQFSDMYHGHWITGVRTTLPAVPGDSGGIVYIWEHPSYNGAAGILIGHIGNWADGGNILITTIQNHENVGVRRF